MPRQPTRFRRVILGVTLAMLAVTLVAWPMSCWRQMYIARVRATDVAPEENTKDPTQWVHAEEIVGVGIRLGLLDLGRVSSHHASWNTAPPRLTTLPDGWSAGLEDFGTTGTFGSRVVESMRPELELSRPTNWRVLGLHLTLYRGPNDSDLCVSVSLVLPTAAFGGLSLWLWWPLRRLSRRLANNQCPKCGYDRKGLAPAASCPECGEVPAPTPPAA